MTPRKAEEEPHSVPDGARPGGSPENPRPAAAIDNPVSSGVNLKVVRGADVGAELVPHAPASPRPIPPSALPSFRRVQMKRDALGYGLSTRERLPTGTGSRFPNCAAQPPLGATMGHGLLPGTQKYDQFYYPGADMFGLGGSQEDRLDGSISN